MSIKRINQVFSTLQKLTKEEKEALADFERRIGVLYKHKKLARKIIQELNSIKKAEELKIKRFKSKEELESIEKAKSAKKSVLNHIRKLESALHTAFYSLSLPESLESLDTEEKSALQKEIDENINTYESLKSMSKKSAERIMGQLQKILMIEKEEKELVNEFESRLNNFKNILNAQTENIKAAIELLSEIQTQISTEDITPAETDSLCFNLNNYQKNIERLLKVEKEELHDALYRLIKDTRRSSRLAKHLSKKDTITIEDIKQDIQTFNKPEEYTFYYSAIQKSGLLPEKVRKLVNKAMYVSGITEEKKTFGIRSLKKIAFIDELTHLGTRHYFKKRIRILLKEASHEGKELYLSLLFFDIDHFKKFNDVYGHDIGDIVLKTFAGYIKSVAQRESDIIVRWGGEESIVLLNHNKPGMTKNLARKTAIDMAERIRTTVELKSTDLMKDINARLKIDIAKHIPKITTSIGVAMYPEDIEEKLLISRKHDKIIARLIKKADECLYYAKEEGGRNCVVFRKAEEYYISK